MGAKVKEMQPIFSLEKGSENRAKYKVKICFSFISDAYKDADYSDCDVRRKMDDGFATPHSALQRRWMM